VGACAGSVGTTGTHAPFVFEFRIDDAAALTPGRITVTSPPADPDRKNNTALINITADRTAGGSETGPSTHPGSGESVSPSPDTAATGTMPATGTQTSWRAAAAAAAMATAGALLFAVSRRRTRRH